MFGGRNHSILPEEFANDSNVEQCMGFLSTKLASLSCPFDVEVTASPSIPTLLNMCYFLQQRLSEKQDVVEESAIHIHRLENTTDHLQAEIIKLSGEKLKLDKDVTEKEQKLRKTESSWAEERSVLNSQAKDLNLRIRKLLSRETHFVHAARKQELESEKLKDRLRSLLGPTRAIKPDIKTVRPSHHYGQPSLVSVGKAGKKSPEDPAEVMEPVIKSLERGNRHLLQQNAELIAAKDEMSEELTIATEKQMELEQLYAKSEEKIDILTATIASAKSKNAISKTQSSSRSSVKPPAAKANLNMTTRNRSKLAGNARGPGVDTPLKKAIRTARADFKARTAGLNADPQVHVITSPEEKKRADEEMFISPLVEPNDMVAKRRKGKLMKSKVGLISKDKESDDDDEKL